MRRGRRSVVKVLVGGALCFPAFRALGERSDVVPNDTADLVWRTGANNPADTLAYNLRTAKVPRFRALCLTEYGVARALTWARERDIPFSILSGGHCFEGLSQNDHLIIDLRHLNNAQIIPGNGLVAGPGATVGQVNLATASIDHALPAGYCQGVGLGGHVGGGGLGVLSRPFGLACDHLTSARVLLANGEFVTAAAEEHPDLFWALRGGGSGSFGIVTSSTFRLQYVPSATFAEFFWILDNAAAARFLADWQATSQAFDRGVTSFLYVKNQTSGRALIRVRMVSTAGPAITANAIDALNALAPSLTEPLVVDGTFQQITGQMWPLTYNPQDRLKVASQYLGELANPAIWHDLLSALDTHRAYEHSIAIEVLGGAIDDQPPDQSAYVHRRGPRFLVQFGVSLGAGDVGGKAVETLRVIQAQLRPATLPGAYVNYPDRDLEDWPAQYWGTNYPRLREVKRRYDAGDAFHHAQSVRL